MSRISTAFVVLLAALVVATLAAATAPGAGQPVYLNPHAVDPRARERPAPPHDAGGEGRPDGPDRRSASCATRPRRPTATATTRAATTTRCRRPACRTYPDRLPRPARSCRAAPTTRPTTRARAGPSSTTRSSTTRSTTRGCTSRSSTASTPCTASATRTGARSSRSRSGMGATWDTDLAEAAGAATRQQLLATGGNWDFAPVQDLARDNRWGRYYETWAEEPALAGRAGRAPTSRACRAGGFDSPQVAATVKHFAGYSQSINGHDRVEAAAADPLPAGHVPALVRRRRSTPAPRP